MRTFVAVDFSAQDFFFSLQDKIDRAIVKGSFAKSFHLTLKFLGKVDENKVEEIVKKLERIEFTPFTVEAGDIGFFPSADYVKVIWIGFKEYDEFCKLNEKVEQALAQFGFKKDFKFVPHVTLARVRAITNKDKFRKNMEGLNVPEKKFEVKSFKLMKSTLTPNGPVYEEFGVFGA